MITATIPMAIQVVIDDVGWWRGDDDSARGGPYRTGCPRAHVPADYLAIADLGRRLGMRPQAAMVLCEWDTEGILRDLPSSTWQGAAWDNAGRQGPWLDETAAHLRDHRAHIEIALHGIGHEYWAGGSPTRAEWHDRDGAMRPAGVVRAHLDYFGRLLSRHAMGDFPSAFVPAAFLHRFGGELAPLLAEYGIRHASTPFASMHRSRETDAADFGFEGGVLTVDRGTDLCAWNETGAHPAGEIAGPVCGMHWPNLLHRDPARNGEAVDRWAALLQPYDSRFDRMLAPDTAAGFAQLVYHRWTGLSVAGEMVTCDFRRVDAAPAPGVPGTFSLKVAAGADAAFHFDGLELLDARREAGHWRLHLRRLPGERWGRIRVRER